MGDAREREDRPQYYSDDHLWIVLAVVEYLKETGDLAFLSEIIPFYDKDPSGAPVESGTVREHLERAVAFTRGDVGKARPAAPRLRRLERHGQPGLGRGVRVHREPVRRRPAGTDRAPSLPRRQGRGKQYEAWYEEMQASFNAHAWDGDWYVRYFDADGTPLGSHGPSTGQIYINAQSWPVISGFAAGEALPGAGLPSLPPQHAPRDQDISAPGFNGFDPAKGGVTTYPPGAKENCGIFLHTNPWVMIAETMVGNGDRAWEYYRQINPAAEERPDRASSSASHGCTRRTSSATSTPSSALPATPGSPARPRGSTRPPRSTSWASDPTTRVCAWIHASPPPGKGSRSPGSSAGHATRSPSATPRASAAASCH